MKQRSCLFPSPSASKISRFYAGFSVSIFAAISCSVMTNCENNDQIMTKQGPKKAALIPLVHVPAVASVYHAHNQFPVIHGVEDTESPHTQAEKPLRTPGSITQGQPVWGRGHCTTALFFLQGEAAPCKVSPFTTKPARVGKPSPRRSPGQPSSSQREGGLKRQLSAFQHLTNHYRILII